MKEAGKKLVLFSSVTFAIIILDQIMKFLASRNICLFFSKNYGAAFSILQGQTWLFILVALFFVVLIIANYKKLPKQNYVQIAFALFLGGTISNLIDRLAFGYVIDYLDFKIFTNNIADIAITIGVIMIVYHFLFKKK